jgi:hypothetical protein
MITSRKGCDLLAAAATGNVPIPGVRQISLQERLPPYWSAVTCGTEEAAGRV